METSWEAFAIVQETYGGCLYKDGGREGREKWMDLRCVLLFVRLPGSVVPYTG